jgi:hypothetical protein
VLYTLTVCSNVGIWWYVGGSYVGVGRGSYEGVVSGSYEGEGGDSWVVLLVSPLGLASILCLFTLNSAPYLYIGCGVVGKCSRDVSGICHSIA